MPMELACLLGGLLCLVRLVMVRLHWGAQVTSDGFNLLRVATEGKACAPFAYRWLLPKLFRNARTWEMVTVASLVLMGPALVGYLSARGFSPGECLAGVALYVGLSGVFALPGWAPVLTDAIGYFWTAVAATFALTGQWEIALVMAFVGGFLHETVPVYIAILAWSPLYLLGVLGYLVSREVARRLGWALPRAERHRLGQTWKANAQHWLNPRLMLIPWGGCLAGLLANDPRVWAALACGYGSMLLATATMRLYQRGAPVLIAATLAVLPGEWLLPVCVGHWFLVSWEGRLKGFQVPGL